MIRVCALWAAGLVVLGAAAAQAQPRAYRGPHPVDLDGHWHHDDAVHVHDELPTGLEPFGDVDGVLVFLADPLAWGFEGDVWTYRGAHPLPGGVPGYCGLSGDHRHPFAPEGTYRRESSGAYRFTGAMRGGVPMARPGRVAPRHPIVTATRGAPITAAPFFQLGCMHQWVTGPDGRPVAVPLAGCIPHRAFPPLTRAPVPPPSPPPAPALHPYSRTRSGPHTRGRRADAAPQGAAPRR